MFALTLINHKSEKIDSRTMPYSPSKKYDFEILGHRGARGLSPENTLAAFEKAIELGVNALELDVVITKDEKVLVSHEAWMNPKICLYKGNPIEANSGKKHNIYQMTYTQTQDYDCGSLVHPDFEEQDNETATKPLLKDVLQMGYALSKNHGIPIKFSIEIKSFEEGDDIYHPQPEKFVHLVLKSVKKHAKTKDVIIQSFDLRILNEVKQQSPKMKVALLTENQDLNTLLKKLNFVPEVFSPHFKMVNQEMIQEVKNHEMKLIPWTVNDMEDMQQLLNLGVDGIITDYPDRALKLKKKKNQ